MYPVNLPLAVERMHNLVEDTCAFRFEMLQSSMTMTLGPAGRRELMRVENFPVACYI